MAKATRATDSDTATPKKRTRKVAVTTEPTNGHSTEVVEVVATAPQTAAAPQLAPASEEKIRVRAYELYLQRRGQHGSPEQDWLQAVAEIRSQHSV